MKIHERRYFKLLAKVLPLPHELVLMCIPPLRIVTENIDYSILYWNRPCWMRIFYGGLVLYHGEMGEQFWKFLEIVYEPAGYLENIKDLRRSSYDYSSFEVRIE